jgi:type I restriction enzyme M protein
LRAKKSAERAGKVLMINSENLFRRGRNQNTLENDHIVAILKTYKNFKSVDGLAQMVSKDEIKQNGFNLNISLYVALMNKENKLTIDECLTDLKEINRLVQESQLDLLAELAEWGEYAKK